MEKYLLLVALICVGTAGQILLKLTTNQLMPQLPEINSLGSLLQVFFIFLKNYKILLLVLLYAAGFFLWFLALTKFEISYSFPIVLASVYVLILLFSWIFLKENITALRLAGILSIALGIVLITKS